MLEAMSANITVLDLKLYELSGFEIKGDVYIDGSTTVTQTLSVGNSLSSYATASYYYDTIQDGTPAYKEGRLFYDTGDHTLSMYTDVPGVSLQIGQEQWVRVVNKTGSTIPNGTPVYINGAQGNRPTIVKASALTHSSADILGITTHDIAINQTGLVTVNGLVRDVDTRDWSEGTNLYLSLTAGILTDVHLPAPYHPAKVGTVIYQHQNQGIIYVATRLGEDLDELHDVTITNRVDGDYIVWNSSLSSWVNKDKNNLNASAIKRNVTILTSSYTALSTDNTLAFTLTSSATLQLPRLSAYGNIEYIIKNKATSTTSLTVSGFRTEMIDNQNTQSIQPRNSMTIVSDGTEWIII
jgi:hypothetical protein